MTARPGTTPRFDNSVTPLRISARIADDIATPSMIFAVIFYASDWYRIMALRVRRADVAG
jgi:hypothetical protein